MKLAWLLSLAACSSHDKPTAPEPARGAAPTAIAQDASVPHPCTVALLVDAAGIWIGTSAGTCRAARIGTKLDLEWVRAQLESLVPAYGDCSAEVVLHAESGEYQELISVMDTAVQRGLLDVAIGEKADLGVAFGPGTPTRSCKTPAPVPAPPPVRRPASPRWEPAIGSSGEILALEAQVALPVSEPKHALRRAPVIVVTRTEITIEGQRVATVDSVPREGTALLQPLLARLTEAATRIERDLAAGTYPEDLVKVCADAKHEIRPVSTAICPVGLAVLQADESTDVRVIHTIIRTAKRAGFDNLLFAVKNQ